MPWAIVNKPAADMAAPKRKPIHSVNASDDPAFAVDFNLPLVDCEEEPVVDRPSENTTLDAITPPNAILRDLAKRNPPSQQWHEGEEECPF